MSQIMPRGFFGYPSNPATIGETIRTAVTEINRGGVAQIRTWEGLNISGRIIIQEILQAIDESQFFCIDLTGLNFNVMFELGYAIARNKVIFPIFDDSFATHRNM